MRTPCLALSLGILLTLAGCPGHIGEPDDDANGDDDTTQGEVEGDEAGECDDGVDNDLDGYADCEDSSCADATVCVDADGDGWSIQDGDCDDADPGAHPGADETPCDGVDNDCDPDTGDEPDADGDGHTVCEECDDSDPDVSPDETEETCDGVDNDCDPATEDAPDGDGDGWSLCEDCDDGDPDVSPGAEEQACDGVDNDCDPATEDAPDGDGDGHASCADCDDGNPDVYPGAYEECDGLDTDCDGSIPLGEVDNDGDGYVACTGPLGDPDCDDLDPNVYPGAAEICDGADGDCDGQLPGDETDFDADGFMGCDGDCDDTDPAQSPLADEYCNGEDDDCDGTVDEDDALDVLAWYEDGDGDGYGDPAIVDIDCAQPQGFADNDLDCDDGDAAVHPGADEVPCDGTDNDCEPATLDATDADGDGHDECSDCDESDGDTYPGAPELCDGEDNDCDGAVPADEDDGDGDGWWECGGDCDDGDAGTYPGAPEQCDNLDNDCDGTPDDGVADDLDGDGHTPCDGDCDDGDGDTHPGANEVCDGIDNDCDGTIPGDEQDGDGDGVAECEGDCNELAAAVYPGAPDICDVFADNDCDGIADAQEVDDDGDGATDCEGDCDDGDPDLNLDDGDSDGWSTCDGDCDDGAPLVHPGQVEDCGDGLDNDCDGAVDNCGPEGTIDLSEAGAKLLGESANDRAGVSLSPAGDVDGDGNGDLLVGGDSWYGGAGGVAHLLYGPVHGTLDLSAADASFQGEASGDKAGRSVACAGDLDGDGFDDVLIGAHNNDEGGGDAGAAYVMYGPVYGTFGLSTADAKLVGEAGGDYAGYATAGAGDVDGDGSPDLLVGAWWNDAGASNGGAAYVVHGPVYGTLDLSASDAKLLGESGDDRAGFSVASAGDMDGDGFDDIFVGAYTSDAGGTDSGIAYLLHGPLSGSIGLGAADAWFVGEDSGDKAGAFVTSAGDVNGDGDPDVLIFAPGDDEGGADAGAAYLIHGPVEGAFDLAYSDAKFVGESSGDLLGEWYAGGIPGDVDGDGYDDILMGAYASDLGGTDSGAAYLLYGPLAGTIDLSTADATFVGEAAGDMAGMTGSLGGDLDGDGYDDILIGAIYDDEGGSNAGAVYVVYGGSN